jgi:type VII secretion-associated protein (TIGR03931 family)
VQDIRNAKETLSRHAYTDVPMSSPFSDVHVTRNDLERLIEEPLRRVVGLTTAAIENAKLRPQQLVGIFLVGGASRIPLVSRLVHELTGVMPTVLDQPETVVARGALLAVAPAPDSAPARNGEFAPPSGSHPTPTRSSPSAHLDTSLRTENSSPVQPSPARGTAFSGLNAIPESGDEKARGRGKKRRWLVAVGALLVVAAALTTFLVFKNNNSPAKDAPQGHVFAQYDYQFYGPTDWGQAGGGVPAERKVVIKPSDAQGGDDLVVVQEYLNGYDASADPVRLVNDLRYSVEQQTSRYSGFNENASFAGRPVIYYRETKGNIVVDWYVVAKGGVRVHVGCQYAGGVPQPRVQSACEQAVRTVEITS